MFEALEIEELRWIVEPGFEETLDELIDEFESLGEDPLEFGRWAQEELAARELR